MSGPMWAQIVLGVMLAIRVVAMAGAVVTLAIGGILGCGECFLARAGSFKFTRGVVSIRHHGVPTPIG